MGGTGSGPSAGTRERNAIFTPLLDARSAAVELANLQREREALAIKEGDLIAAILAGTRRAIGAANKYYFPGDSLGDLETR